MEKITKCDKCGGLLRFNPRTKMAECSRCGTEKKVEFDRNIKRHSINMEGEVKELSSMNKGYTLKCISCGASFQGTELKMTGTCKYCGAHLVEDFQESLSTSPDGIIPFAFDKEGAKIKFKEAVKKKAFVPNAFKKSPPDSDIQSIYIPAFVFDCDSETDYRARLSYRDTDGDATIYRESKVSGRRQVSDRGILVECSEYMTQLTLDKIKPFDLMGECAYNPLFLMGYSVEHLNRSLSEVRDIVKQIHLENIKKTILKQYSYDKVSDFFTDTKYLSAQYGYIILPTYKVVYSYKGKTYNTFMNGQTGKIEGNLPQSGWKIFLTILAVLGVVAGFGLLLFMAISGRIK